MQDPKDSGSSPEFSLSVTYAPPAGTPEREVWQRDQEAKRSRGLMSGTEVAQRTVRLDHNGSRHTARKKFKDGVWSRPRPVFSGSLPKLSRQGRIAATRIRRAHRSTALPRRARGCSGRPARRPSHSSAQARAPSDEGEGGGDAGPHRLNAPLERFLAGLLVRCATERGVPLALYAENVKVACHGEPELLRSFSGVLSMAEGVAS